MNEQLRITQARLTAQQELLIKTARQQTVGDMSAGICHQINNPLAIIMGRAMILRSHLEQENLQNKEHVLNEISIIEETSLRISDIIKSLRLISSNDQGEITRFNLSEVINSVIVMSKTRINSSVLELELIDDVKSPVTFNKKVLIHALLALMSNSFEALAEVEQKKLKIELVEKENEFRIILSDSGPGIQAAIADKMFEPFFSTKPKNFGMGLSISKKGLNEHGAELIYQQSGEWTVFEIILPKTPS